MCVCGSAEKDPAVGLFKTYWGEDWAEDFTHNFLFSMSEPPAKQAAAGPVASGAGVCVCVCVCVCVLHIYI